MMAYMYFCNLHARLICEYAKNYVNMQLIYDNMQLDYFDMQYMYVIIQHYFTSDCCMLI